MGKQLDKAVIARMMDRAIEINRGCKEECRDFQIMVSPMKENTLILRWITIDIEDIDRPVQCYNYECFNLDGTSQHCGVNYDSPEQANDFFWGLESLYRQEYAIDHRLSNEKTKS